MNGWYLTKGKFGPYLKHDCAFLHGAHFGSTDEQGRWYCSSCKALAPEEMDFIADLAIFTKTLHVKMDYTRTVSNVGRRNERLEANTTHFRN